ncbi:glutaredoxin domain-containing protein [Pseudovibrio ascidiaceicola]|uniref:glutaredoxin domain-containing protein n=1 Tax=Pseudovibrio ascidiaceicola TaxID=285279 RepID=UPI003D35E353
MNYTIFTQADCLPCVRAKKALAQSGKDYVAFSIEEYPAIRKLMLAVGLYTLPQVFKGPVHIGGADDLLKHLKQS